MDRNTPAITRLHWLLNELYHGNEFSREQLWTWIQSVQAERYSQQHQGNLLRSS